MIHATINGIAVQAHAGDTVLQVAERYGIQIPTLCYLKDLDPDGSCRLCMVEIEGNPKLVTACSFPLGDGDVVYTESEKVVESRKSTLDLMLSHHATDCFSCGKNGACKLQDYCYRYGVERTSYPKEAMDAPIDDSNEFFTYNPNLCVLCHRCVNTCQKLVGRGTIGTAYRGMDARIGPAFKQKWSESDCERCGNCAQACPTGALQMRRRKKYRPWEVKKVLTTCPHCGTGCQYYLLVKDNRIVDTEAYDGASNRGLLCVKGRSASFDFIHSGDRITDPLIRDRATGKLRKASWNEALELVAQRMMEIKEQYGGDALAGFACSRSPNEDIYMVQKMVRTCFGTNNTDNCARVCHSASVAGLAMTLGSGAMTNPIGDITTDVDAILLIGSNPEEAHPVIGMQIRRAVANGAKLIVVDPREINLAKRADVHLKLRPGTNVAFANGMMNVFINENLIDEDFIAQRTEGFEKLKKIVLEYTPERVAEICHIDAEDLRRAARIYAKADKAPIIYCLGVTEHSTGTEGVMSMSNMAMMVGKIGRPGCGVNPLRGQNNVQGACDMGAQPGDFPGYQKILNRDGTVNELMIRKFEKAWGVPLNRKSGLHATDTFPAMIDGRVKGLYIYGEDPVVTDPDTSHVIRALQSLDFFVLQELFLTETARYADVILPGRAYAEKEGTFTNTERRVQRVRKAVTVPGNMRQDTDIIIGLMNCMGYPQPYKTAAQIMDEIASLTPSYAGISHARLDSNEISGRGLQWPCLNDEHPGTPIMHVGKFSRGLGWFYPAEYVPSAELPDEEYPTILMTGRILYHYTTRAMTGRTPELMEIEGHSFVELNAADAEKLSVTDGERVRVISRRGSIETTARVGEKCSPGECWMPFHFPDGNCNWLTNAALDRYARIPEYKVCAVRIEKL